MRVEELSAARVAALLAGSGLRLRFGPCNVRISTDYPQLVDSLYPLYAKFEIAEGEIADFHASVVVKHYAWRPFSPSVLFLLDGQAPFSAVPVGQALEALQRGIKWALAVRISHLLMLRSAVLARNGFALLLPYTTAGDQADALRDALLHNGFRLLSDTFGAMELNTAGFYPLPTLLARSNETSGGAAVHGKVAGHERTAFAGQISGIDYRSPPADSHLNPCETVAARWVVAPQYVADAPSALESLSGADAIMLLTSNSFNYEQLGECAFQAVTKLLRSADCYRLVYSDILSALAILVELTDEA